MTHNQLHLNIAMSNSDL